MKTSEIRFMLVFSVQECNLCKEFRSGSGVDGGAQVNVWLVIGCWGLSETRAVTGTSRESQARSARGSQPTAVALDPVI